MPFKTVKKDTAEALTLEWVLQIKNYKLTVDKNRCVGCQICTLACPKEAVKTQKQVKTAGKKTEKAVIDIDLAKCNFCGICDVTCPYGAIKVTLNGGHDLNILGKESYPQLVRDIQIDNSKIKENYVDCETICPLDLIKVSKTESIAQPVANMETPQASQFNIKIQKDYCPTCRMCEFKFPSGAIKVKKTYEGLITINQEKCPQDCKDCLDVCPITGALELGKDNKVHVNELFCTFCGACKNVCPVDDALTVKRTAVHHTPIHSGTWNKSLARLTSPDEAVKELKAQAAKSRREAVSKRFVLEETVK